MTYDIKSKNFYLQAVYVYKYKKSLFSPCYFEANECK